MRIAKGVLVAGVVLGAGICAGGGISIAGGGISLAAGGDELTIDRIFEDPSLNGPTVRQLKFSPDGSRSCFKGKN